MKKTILAMLVVMTFQTVKAGTLQLTCQTSVEETVKIYVSTDKSKNPAYMEIYSQGGLGPNFLDSSYVASETDLTISPDDQVTLNARFSNLVNVKLDIGTKSGEGLMTFDGAKAIELSKCSY